MIRWVCSVNVSIHRGYNIIHCDRVYTIRTRWDGMTGFCGFLGIAKDMGDTIYKSCFYFCSCLVDC